MPLLVTSSFTARLIGGTFGPFFTPGPNSVVNISGGSFSNRFSAQANSEVNLFGSDFALNGVPLDISGLDGAFTIIDRDVTLSGLFADGSEFSFDLNSTILPEFVDFFHPNATLSVTLGPLIPAVVPEPGSLSILGLGGVILLRRRRKTV